VVGQGWVRLQRVDCRSLCLRRTGVYSAGQGKPAVLCFYLSDEKAFAFLGRYGLLTLDFQCFIVAWKFSLY
jgi:hypothetical protein